MKTPKIADILQAIREKRKTLKYSQADMAKELGIGQRAYASLENGTNEMKVSYLFKLIELLEIENIFVNQAPENDPSPNLDTAQDLAKVLQNELGNIQDLLEKVLKK